MRVHFFERQIPSQCWILISNVKKLSENKVLAFGHEPKKLFGMSKSAGFTDLSCRTFLTWPSSDLLSDRIHPPLLCSRSSIAEWELLPENVFSGVTESYIYLAFLKRLASERRGQSCFFPICKRKKRTTVVTAVLLLLMLCSCWCRRVCARVCEPMMRVRLGSLLNICLLTLFKTTVVTKQAIKHVAANCCLPFIARCIVFFCWWHFARDCTTLGRPRTYSWKTKPCRRYHVGSVRPMSC